MQVDAAQGAEDMVEQLTDKTLKQEELVQEILEEKSDLVGLCQQLFKCICDDKLLI